MRLKNIQLSKCMKEYFSAFPDYHFQPFVQALSSYIKDNQLLSLHNTFYL